MTDAPYVQQHGFISVIMLDGTERAGATRHDGDAQLLPRFACRRRLYVFAGLQLAAGQLAVSAHVLTSGTTSSQSPPVLIVDHPDRDMDACHSRLVIAHGHSSSDKVPEPGGNCSGSTSSPGML